MRIALIILLSLILGGCSNVSDSTNATIPTAKSDVISGTFEEYNTLDISKQLLVKYLEHKPNGTDAQIIDYKISEVKIYSETSSEIVFTAKYSVQYDKNQAGSGNGILSENGWILDKFQFFKVTRNGKTYQIIDITTAPPVSR